MVLGRVLGSMNLIVLGTLFLIALVLGVFGFARQGLLTGEPFRFLDCLYKALQLFVLESNPDSRPIPLSLQVARFLAPFLTLSTLLAALMQLFRRQFREFRLRRLRGHAVVCGLGRKGLEFAGGLRKRGRKVIVVEARGGPEIEMQCRMLGAHLVIGNAREKATLRRARIQEADLLAGLCGSDGANLEIASAASTLVGNGADGRRILCLAHGNDLDLAELFRRNGLFQDQGEAFEFRVFCVHEIQARLFFREHLLALCPGRGTRESSLRIIIVGESPLAQSLVMLAVRVGHFPDGKRVKIDWFQEGAEEKCRRRHPYLSRAADLRFHPATADPARIAGAVTADARPDRRTVLVLCLPDDAENFALGLGLRETLAGVDTPIFVRLSEEGGFQETVRRRTDGLVAFGPSAEACHPDYVLDQKQDILARAFHEYYRKDRLAEPDADASSPNLQPWNRLREDFRESNRQQADHLMIKLRALGYRIAGASEEAVPAGFSREEALALAAMEHARWCAERFLAGWSYHESRDNARKLHPLLKPWEGLTAEARQGNIDAILKVPAVLGEAGWRLVAGTGRKA